MPGYERLAFLLKKVLVSAPRQVAYTELNTMANLTGLLISAASLLQAPELTERHFAKLALMKCRSTFKILNLCYCTVNSRTHKL